MPRTALLHIGIRKTGSTSIQAWLHARRNELANRGVHILRAAAGPAVPVHNGLIEIARRNTDASALHAELSGLPDSACTVLMSSENISHHLWRDAHVKRLKAVLDPHFDEYRVVVYLRRQDELACSMLSTQLRLGLLRDVKRTAKHGESEQLSWCRGLLDQPPLDYRRMLDLWAEVFGRKAIVPRIFGRGELIRSDAVSDFAATAGVGDISPLGMSSTNPSLRPAAQMFLAALGNARRGGKLERSPAFSRMIKLLNKRFAGLGMLPSQGAAREYMERCEASNEAVRKSWFPERVRLFSGDFSRYPMEPTPSPTAEEMNDVALAVMLEILGVKRRGDKRKAGLGPNAPTAL